MTFITNPDFSQFDVIARPMAERESRVFYDESNGRKQGICYRSHSLALARSKSLYSMGGGLTILVEHGGGREALSLHSIYGPEADWLLSITDERQQYAALWVLYNTAKETRNAARQETAARYSQAFAEGRLKKRRKNNRVYVEITPPAVAAETVA